MVQELPELMLAPSLHGFVAAFETPAGALHVDGVHVAAVSDPALQLLVPDTV